MPAHSDVASLMEGCAREPIHLPGKIQAHGFLLACDSGLTLRYVSANVSLFLDISPQRLLGTLLFDLFDGERLREHWLSALGDSESAIYLGQFPIAGKGRFDTTAHWCGGLLIVELEPCAEDVTAASTYLGNHFEVRLREAKTSDAICAVAVDELKRITGFGRVLAYVFDTDGHGRVLAERADPGYERYNGLHFPASDIPEQARALYRLNPIRVIPDVDYEPSPLVADPAYAGQSLDLGFATLRSVSPVHLQYMRNMSTPASMSISILVEGRLWGLVSCHHNQPRRVPAAMRRTCELVGRILSLQVEARESHDETRRRLDQRNLMVTMLAAMADRDSVADGLLAIPDTCLAFGAATGAVLVIAGRCHRIGDAPAEEAVRALAGWLSAREQRSVFATDALAEVFPAAADFGLAACGLLAVAISEIHANYILWFRPEVVATVTWAGAPEKLPDRKGAALSPRTSFSAWQQILRGRSRPWTQEDIDAAVMLRDSIRGIVLRKAEELADMADELRHANGELEAFSYSVSHDLRAPLRHIAGYTELLQEYEGEHLSERARHYLRNIGESVNFAGTLVDELLAFSQMGRSALRLSSVDVGALVQHVRQELAPDYVGRDIDWIVHPLPAVTCDGAFLHLALRNLIANAIKYTRDAERARIEITARTHAGEHIFSIRDNGVGFDMRYAGKLFGVFQRLHSMDEFEGTGIGLANVRRIVERHGGRVWAEGEPGRGAVFSFALPLVIPTRLQARPVDAQGG